MNAKTFVAHIVPLMDCEERQVFAEEAELKLFNEVIIEGLKDVLKHFSNAIKEIDDYADKLHMIADIIVAFFKTPLIPLLKPPLIFANIPEKSEVVLSDVKVDGFKLKEELKDLVYRPWVSGKKASISDPVEVFWTWILSRNFPNLKEIWSISPDRTVIDHIQIPHALFEAKNKFSDAYREVYKKLLIDLRLIGHIQHQKFWRVFLATPQDTRPGLNTAKLIPHLLATSAVAYSMWTSKNKNKNRKILKLELAILRLASLLHDIGKPRSWLSIENAEIKYPHPEESAKLATELLRSINLPEDIVNAVSDLIRSHHKPSNLGVLSIGNVNVNLTDLLHTLIKADRASSTLDRLAEISAKKVASVLGDEEDKVRNMLLKSGKEVWQYWLSISPDGLKKASEETAKYLLQMSEKQFPLIQERPNHIEGVFTLAFDVMGIQDFIYREKLPIVVGASYAVDLITLYALPRALVEAIDIPPECIIYAGGGMVYAISPDVDDKNLENAIKKAKQILMNVNLNVAWAKAQLYETWLITASELNAKLEENKRTIPIEDSWELGFEVLCDICHKNPAVKKKNHEYICYECSVLEELGYLLHFHAKIEWLKEIEKNLIPKWEQLQLWILEWLSGCEIESEPIKNIALVKADGNMIGAFMAKSISISDAILRSIRIDRSLKLAIFEAMRGIFMLKNLTENRKEQEEFNVDVARMFTGLLYSGGDDMVAIWPARISLQAISAICYWFWAGLGGLRQLSVGLASGKPKHNIWALIRTSEELMSVCKGKLRESLYRAKKDIIEVMPGIVGLFAAVYADTHVPLPCWVHEQVMKTPLDPNIANNSLTWQPLAFLTRINNDQKKESIEWLGLPNAWKIFNLLVDFAVNGKIRERVKKVFEGFYYARKGQFVSARDLRTVIREIHAAWVSLGRRADILTSFLVNRIFKAREERKRIYTYLTKMVLELYLNSPPPLIDAFNLAKFVLGE